MNSRLMMLLIATLGTSGVAWANPEGKALYAQYRCADCHGEDGKKVTSKGMVPLAGMDPDDIYYKTRKFMESRSHEQVTAGCGEPPSSKQIKKISDWLATLPK
jgi:cytochrome c553